MKEKTLNEKIEEHLFCDKETLPEIFSVKEIDKVKRIRFAFSRWLEEPTLSTKEIRVLLKNQFAISDNTAFRDIPILTALMGNVKNASKDFFRYRANFMVAQAYKLNSDAKTILEVKQADVAIKAAIAIAKINKLDKDDILPHAWDEIEPSSYEITSDVSVLGLKPLAKSADELEELKNKMRKKYGYNEKRISDVEEIINEREEKNIPE